MTAHPPYTRVDLPYIPIFCILSFFFFFKSKHSSRSNVKDNHLALLSSISLTVSLSLISVHNFLIAISYRSKCFLNCTSSERIVTNMENSLASCFFDHLWVYHAMDPYVIENHVLPPRVDPQLVQDDRPLLEKKNNIMT